MNLNNLFKSRFVRHGLPFSLLLIGGSFAFRNFTTLRDFYLDLGPFNEQFSAMSHQITPHQSHDIKYVCLNGQQRVAYPSPTDIESFVPLTAIQNTLVCIEGSLTCNFSARELANFFSNECFIDAVQVGPSLYDFSRNEKVSPDQRAEIEKLFKKPHEYNIDTEYEKYKQLDIENWSNKRGPRPWEEEEQSSS